MAKFKITTDRMREACGILEVANLQARNIDTVVRVAPRFVIDPGGEYAVKIEYDDDGDIERFSGYKEAFEVMAFMPAKKIQKLAGEFEKVANMVLGAPSQEVSAQEGG